MNTSTKINSFVSEVIARLKGDSPKAVAEKNFRMADSAINSQIATLKAKTVKDENMLEDAKEALKNAKYPTDPIRDTEEYIRNIVTAQEAVDKAQKEADATIKSIKYFEEMAAANKAEISE
jgi:hypothetical protein